MILKSKSVKSMSYDSQKRSIEESMPQAPFLALVFIHLSLVFKAILNFFVEKSENMMRKLKICKHFLKSMKSDVPGHPAIKVNNARSDYTHLWSLQ